MVLSRAHTSKKAQHSPHETTFKFIRFRFSYGSAPNWVSPLNNPDLFEQDPWITLCGNQGKCWKMPHLTMMRWATNKVLIAADHLRQRARLYRDITALSVLPRQCVKIWTVVFSEMNLLKQMQLSWLLKRLQVRDYQNVVWTKGLM